MLSSVFNVRHAANNTFMQSFAAAVNQAELVNVHTISFLPVVYAADIEEEECVLGPGPLRGSSSPFLGL